MWFVIIVLDNAVYLFVWFFLSINGNGISFISVSVDENASTGEQAGRELLGSGCITFLCLQVKCLCFYLKGVSFWEPKVWDSLSWRKQKSQNLLPISAAVSSFNKFDNDGSFMHKFLLLQNDEANKLMVRVTGISISHPN